MSGLPNASVPTSHPDPQQDRATGDDQPSGRIQGLLGLVRKLIDCGKGLATALQQRPPAIGPRDLFLRFGTIDIALILAHITRGLHRAAALEARLLDLLARPPAQPAAPARTPAARKPRPVRVAEPGAEDGDSKLAHMPTPAEITAQVRRRRIGTVLADICRELGILLNHPLWQELNLAIIDNGGNAIPLLKAFLNRPFFSPDIDPATPLVPPMPVGWRPSPRLSFADALRAGLASDPLSDPPPASHAPSGAGPASDAPSGTGPP